MEHPNVFPNIPQEALLPILRERERQIDLWDNTFDDTHTQNDWVAFITSYAGNGMWKMPGDFCDEQYPNIDAFKDAMVKVGALAVAALSAVARYEEKDLG